MKADFGRESITSRGIVGITRPVIGKIATFLAVMLALLLVGCGTAVSPTNTPTPAAAPPTLSPTVGPVTTGSPGAASEESQPLGGVTIDLGEDSVARYLVREQLARLDLPNDAVGETSDVGGSITFNADGSVDSNAAIITVDLTTLQSDEDRRNRYLRTRSLQSDTFPTAEFVIQETPGLPWPLPLDGEATFQLVGDMTLHGVTRPLTWDATAQFNDNSVSGQARTSFTFEEFDMDVPSVSVVLSVENDIRLEIDFAGSISQG